MNTEQLIVSIGTILLAVNLFGWIFQSIRQPRVVGEMMAGIVLGPSLFGHFFPAAFAHIFPASSLAVLAPVSQLGLLLFMFIVGLEVDLDKILRQRVAVVLISNVSVLLPLALGIGLATLFYPRFAGEHVTFYCFAMFMGTAMSITAFPVLARILKEHNLLGTDFGTIAISCAAIDDVSAWLLLAIVTAMVHSSHTWVGLAIMMLRLLLFAAVMLFPVRRAASWLKPLGLRHSGSLVYFSFIILLILASSWVTERLGIHALFGAFMAGLIVPKEKRLTVELLSKIESLTVVLLLPLFFAITGLRTHIDLLSGTQMWGYTLVIIVIAIIGKFAGATLTSYSMGMRWRESVALGILMNTRGLVELVVLNVGLELGVVSSSLFTMMVIMALCTTFMATPLLVATKITQEDESMSLLKPILIGVGEKSTNG